MQRCVKDMESSILGFVNKFCCLWCRCCHMIYIVSCEWHELDSFSSRSSLLTYLKCLADDGEESFDDDFDKIDNSVSFLSTL